MKVYLKPGWESILSTNKPRVYPLGIDAKQRVDEIFDKMQFLDGLKYMTFHTPYSFLVFVI